MKKLFLYGAAIILWTTHASATIENNLDDRMVEEDEAHILETASTTEIEKNQISSLTQSLSEYRRFRHENRAEIKEFKHRYRNLKKALRDQDSSLSFAVRITRQTCEQTPELCRNTVATILNPQFKKIMEPDSYTWFDAFLPKANAGPVNAFTLGCEVGGASWHAIVYGQQSLDCDDDVGHDVRVTIHQLGPGAYFGGGALAIFCLGNEEGPYIGAVAGGAFLFGAQAGLFIGRGACAMLGVNVGLGAYAGLALLDF